MIDENGKVVFPHQCPVCKKYNFIEPFEECQICHWTNDIVQEKHSDWDGCGNIMNLKEAKQAYKEGKKIH